uniref:Sushi domain containing 5 n=1 Tax=Cyprinodon variegatus TaxID=28743 RepID=A0A3Q2DYA3_CYPVA
INPNPCLSTSPAHLPLPTLNSLSLPLNDALLRLSTGRVFILSLRNLQGFREAEQACASQHARLASAEELRQAVVGCFFSHCTRGWLYGATVGTTVCNTDGSSLKAVDVKTENATEETAHLSAFCIKDKVAACGDPPSFPYARLQDHSGSEMGDELLYMCAPGYMMPSGHTSFSLLCDSCGEWYGTVQICVKDAAETHLDYEDNFEDSFEKTDHNHDSHEEVFAKREDDFTIHPRFAQDRDKLVQVGAAEATKEPVSLLSQKHMFWFPSEAFQEEVPPFTGDSVTQATQRASGGQSEESKENESRERVESIKPSYDDHDSREDDTDHPHVIITVGAERRLNITQKEEGHKTKGNTWLDGYPVDLLDSTKRQMRPSVVKTTNTPNKGDTHKQVPPISLSDEDKSLTTAPKSDQGKVKKGVSATSPDRVEHSNPPSYSDYLDYGTQQAAPTHSWLNDLTGHPFLDHGPAPPMHDLDPFPGAIEEHIVENLPGEMGEMEGEKRQTICVGEDCPPNPPSSTSQGAKVAAIIVAVCAVATAVIVGLWCFRRRQQKSSIYEMNGKQNQQIEMEQKV